MVEFTSIYVLGINAYHGDSSACLTRDGILLAAAEEERFRRIKHCAGFPSAAIGYCLETAGIPLSRLDHVAINRDSPVDLLQEVGFALKKRPDFGMVLERLKNAKQWCSIEESFAETFPGEALKAQVHHVEHHHAHLSSAFYVSPFEKAVVASVDGFGDFASAAWGVGKGSEISIDDKVYFPHSLGIFYQALTQYIGFPHYGDEYKVMGLAPYGEPKFIDEMRQIVLLQEDGSYRLNLDYFVHHKETAEVEWKNGVPSAGLLFSAKLESLLGPKRGEKEELTQKHKDMARSIQAMYEEGFFNLLAMLHRTHSIDNLALAGGCAMNSVANGKITKKTPFKKVYIQAAAGDAGGAIGAAFAVWHGLGNNKRDFVMDHAYWGPEFSMARIAGLLEEKQDDIQAAGCRFELIDSEEEICRRTARAIAEGQVIGWFQGRMEWGPRALGIAPF